MFLLVKKKTNIAKKVTRILGIVTLSLFKTIDQVLGKVKLLGLKRNNTITDVKEPALILIVTVHKMIGLKTKQRITNSIEINHTINTMKVM